MQESTEPSLTKPAAGEEQCDAANTAHSEGRDSAPQTVVSPNFVEIFHIPKPDTADKETINEEETDGETDDSANSPGEEQMRGEWTGHEQGQKPAKKEPLPSDITYAEAQKAFNRGDVAEASRLVIRMADQAAAERRAEKEARAAEEERRFALESSADQQDDEESAEEEQSEIQPEQIAVNIGGRPAKTAGLIDIEELIRGEDVIETVHYVSHEDGIINQFSSRFYLPSDLRPLYKSLFLPSGVEGFRMPRELFNDISALLRKHVMLASKDCSLLAYWAIATWFADFLPFFPSVVISGPASTADLLLRTLAAVCRRPVLLGELSPAILRKLPVKEISPTLLIREPQLSRYMSALLNASNQPGYLFFSGKSFQELYCPKTIYVGESFKDSAAARNSVHINLGESTLPLRKSLPGTDEITFFQNRLLCYRLLNHDKVAAANFRVSGFRPELSVVADVLASAIVDDVELQRGIIEVLKDRDEQSRIDHATGVNGLVLRAVLFHCHQRDERKFVREITATANRFYAEDGESLRLSSEKVGHVLKYLGLYSRRLGNAGRGLVFDKPTQAQAHMLSHEYDVLTSEPSCEHCHELQHPQSGQLVQGV
jgi:hypothetical protein